MGKILEFQQNTLEWHLARLGKVTGSRVKDALMKPTTQGYQNAMASIIAERLTSQPPHNVSNKAMEWGTKHEPEARREHAFICSHQIREVGFVELNNDMGCSPDGLYDNDTGLVEYKCPYNDAVHIKTLLKKEVPAEYVPQVQWNLFVTGCTKYEFVSFNPRMPEALRLAVVPGTVDLEYQAEMLTKVEAFLKDMHTNLKTLEEIVEQSNLSWQGEALAANTGERG